MRVVDVAFDAAAARAARHLMSFSLPPRRRVPRCRFFHASPLLSSAAAIFRRDVLTRRRANAFTLFCADAAAAARLMLPHERCRDLSAPAFVACHEMPPLFRRCLICFDTMFYRFAAICAMLASFDISFARCRSPPPTRRRC